MIVQPPYSNWAFRGERDERWPLYSSLSRYLQNFGVDAGRLAAPGSAASCASSNARPTSF